MKPTEKIEIDVNIIFSIQYQKFYIDVKKYQYLKYSKIYISESILFTEIYDVNEAAKCIEQNNLIKRVTPKYIYYENKLETKKRPESFPAF